VEGAAVLGRLIWRVAKVVELRPETSQTKTIVFDVPDWPGHRAGQHVDVRLTAEDGYQAERSYSIASAANGSRVELTVERLDDGEVSPYLTDVLMPGDEIELRGPVGGYFVWDPQASGHVLLVGGGSGVVPLMAMARQRAGEHSSIPTKLLYSARTWDDVIYGDELAELSGRNNGFEVVYTLTRAQPAGWTGYDRRVDRELLGEVAPSTSELALSFVCGPTPFVEAVASSMVELGYEPVRIKTERFGPTGGR
jgi:ferredoxin-NADP reductase